MPDDGIVIDVGPHASVVVVRYFEFVVSGVGVAVGPAGGVGVDPAGGVGVGVDPRGGVGVGVEYGNEPNTGGVGARLRPRKPKYAFSLPWKAAQPIPSAPSRTARMSPYSRRLWAGCRWWNRIRLRSIRARHQHRQAE